MGITYTRNNFYTSQFSHWFHLSLVSGVFVFLIVFMDKLKRENLQRGLMSVQVCSIAGCTKMQ